MDTEFHNAADCDSEHSSCQGKQSTGLCGWVAQAGFHFRASRLKIAVKMTTKLEDGRKGWITDLGGDFGTTRWRIQRYFN